jgi:hypothetical protein
MAVPRAETAPYTRAVAGRWLLGLLVATIAVGTPGTAQAFTCQNRDFVLDSLANGRAVSAELNYQGPLNEMLRARATAHDVWERYRMVCLDGGQFAIIALNTGRYVSAELGYADKDTGMLRARATVVDRWERFTFEDSAATGTFVRGALKSVANGRYVTVELGYETTDARYGMLRARAEVADRWEQLELTWLPQPAAPGPVDADGDGFFVGQDCNDGNPAIRPGALETRGNGVDENCDGRDEAPLQIVAGVSVGWRVVGPRVTITKLRVTEVLAGERVEIRCSGRRCPMKRLRGGKPRRGTVNLLKTIGKRRSHRFHAGQTLEVRITAPDRIGRVVRWRLRRGKIPNSRPLCLPPGAERPRRCS